MQEIYIKSATAVVKLIAKENIISAIINDSFFFSYIPSIEILNKTTKNIDAVIKVEETTENILNIDYPNIYYGYKKLNIKDIVSLVEFIFERARQEKGIICIHGAGAIVNDKLIACWGTATGMRKNNLGT